ncbi:low molecular weight phosphotyrosine protein phosphatase [Gelidibacter sp. F2691]|nr:low molecular weight phosphotyrosine protein phosphatase [Gelidibacter sp. F2691]
MTTHVLFVCLGNICRSPSAEGIFRSLATEAGLDVLTDSAGTSNWHVGDPPYVPMQVAAKLRDFDLSDLRARQFTARDFEQFDMIIGMDDSNIDNIENLRPEGSQTPVRLFTDFAPEAGMDHVPDPFYTRDFDQTLDLVQAASVGLIKHLD